ncbi:putative quinol monooxygenase [Sphingomonas sp. C3-2]|uniref:putative quinol monooxygenase n=1 Tax=Sphingomonas sp. C3-2 TaxID=3062169 RepID=UPI00294B3474|nr:antibiotic biosynthesis monooxygenase [Sphingomonas sp. C3-2]WOK37851.1 antibiotic biosynthesis monooxygenase [Sphingomonas sp. C3-2]
MIIVTGAIRCNADSFGKLLAKSLEHCERMRGEPGCLGSNVHVDCEDQHRLVFLEFWRDEAAVRAHFLSRGAKNFGAYIHAHAEEVPEICVFSGNRLTV